MSTIFILELKLFDYSHSLLTVFLPLSAHALISVPPTFFPEVGLPPGTVINAEHTLMIDQQKCTRIYDFPADFSFNRAGKIFL